MTTSTTDEQLSLLSIRDGQVTWDVSQKQALIDVLRVRHATEADLGVFFHQARRTGLDPFLRQLYMIARQEWDPETRTKQWRQTFQTGIDGFRVVAHRRARQLNQVLTYDDPVYYDDEGRAYEVWLDDDVPARAIKFVVHMGGSRFPFTARYADFVVTKDEYEPDTKDDKGKTVKGKPTGRRVPQGMWATRPTSQLEKCAEAGALRRACPQDLSGIYEFTEMERQDQPITTLVDDGATTSRPAPRKTGTDWVAMIKAAKNADEARKIWQECTDAGERSAAFDEVVREVVGKFSHAQSTVQEAEQPDASEAPESGESDAEGTPEDAPSTVHPDSSTAVDEPGDAPVACQHGIYPADACSVCNPDEPPSDEGDDPWRSPAAQ